MWQIVFILVIYNKCNDYCLKLFFITTKTTIDDKVVNIKSIKIMSFFKVLITFIITILLFASPAYAGCIYNGTTYPTGSQIGDYVCQPDGTWQRNSN